MNIFAIVDFVKRMVLTERILENLHVNRISTFINSFRMYYVLEGAQLVMSG